MYQEIGNVLIKDKNVPISEFWRWASIYVWPRGTPDCFLKNQEGLEK